MLMIKPIITKMHHLTRLQIASKSILCIELQPNHAAGARLRDDNEFCLQAFLCWLKLGLELNLIICESNSFKVYILFVNLS